MNIAKIPSLVWGLVAVAALVGVGAIWLYFHDVRIREGAEATRIITSLDSTIAVVSKQRDSLLVRIKDDSTLLARRETTFVRVAVVPAKLRDSLLALNRTLDSLTASGASVVPIGIAQDAQRKLNACSAKVDSLVSAGTGVGSACEARVATLRGVIRDDSLIARAKDSVIEVMKHAPRASDARLKLFVDGGEAFQFKRAPQIQFEGGALLRLLGPVGLKGSLFKRDSVGAYVGVHIVFR